MATPEHGGRAGGHFLPAPNRRVARIWPTLRIQYERLVRSDLRFVPWVVLVGLLLAPGVAAEQWQYVLLIVFVVSAGSLYMRWPTVGLALVVVLWIIAPLIRRLLDYFVESKQGPDILSLAPFFATLVIGVLAYRRQKPSKAVLIVMFAVWAGFLWGTPAGLDDPFPLMFAMFSYLAATVGLLLGYHDWKRGTIVLEKLLLVIIPIVAAYAIYQFITPFLPPWDALWLKFEAPISIGTKEQGTFRAFSTLNSPGMLAGVLALFALMLLVGPRLTPWRLAAGGLTMAALLFTQVRSAWIAMAVAMVALIPVSRGGILGRVAVLLVILGGMYVFAGGSTAGQAVVDRAASVGDASSGGDHSTNERIQAITEFGPKALVQPIGDGLGSVSQASRLSSKGEPPFADNGYLLIMWQTGLLGFLLVFGGILAGTIYGARQLNSYKRKERFPFVAIVIVTGVQSAAADTLFGLAAVILWYSLGALMASSEDPGCEAIRERKRLRQASAEEAVTYGAARAPAPAPPPREPAPVA